MFEGWDNYFFLTGSAAGGLIGLLFVVVTLTAGFERSSAMRGAALFMTPTMVHFAVVLSISAVAVAPRLPLNVQAALMALVTLAGLANAMRASLGIARPMPDATAPHWSDFWCYGAAPTLLYVGLLTACALLLARVAWAPQALAALLLALLLLGIRNAWDLVTWIAPQGSLNPAQLTAPPSPN